MQYSHGNPKHIKSGILKTFDWVYNLHKELINYLKNSYGKRSLNSGADGNVTRWNSHNCLLLN